MQPSHPLLSPSLGSVAGFSVCSPHRVTLQRRESPGRKARPGVSIGREGALYIDAVIAAQSLSCVLLFATPWATAHQASLSFTTSWSLLRLMSIESMMPSNHLILCCSLLLPPSIIPSIMVFSNESGELAWGCQI